MKQEFLLFLFAPKFITVWDYKGKVGEVLLVLSHWLPPRTVVFSVTDLYLGFVLAHGFLLLVDLHPCFFFLFFLNIFFET